MLSPEGKTPFDLRQEAFREPASETETAWAKVERLLQAFANLKEDEPKMAAVALGKAHKHATAWSKLAQKDDE